MAEPLPVSSVSACPCCGDGLCMFAPWVFGPRLRMDKPKRVRSST